MRHVLKVCGILLISTLALTGCRGDSVVAIDEQGAEAASSVQSAANTVPFHAMISFELANVPPPPPPIVHSLVSGAGKAKPFGPLDFFGNSQIDISLPTSSQTVEIVFTFRSGDELYATATGDVTPIDPPGNVVLTGDISFHGGTGRFENAIGTGTYTGSAIETAPREGVGELTIDGKISGFGGVLTTITR